MMEDKEGEWSYIGVFSLSFINFARFKVLRNFEWEMNLWILLVGIWDWSIDREKWKGTGIKIRLEFFTNIFYIYLYIYLSSW